MKHLKLAVLAMIVLTAGCNLGHTQQMGAATGAVVGGLLGNTVGKGDGRVASTAFGTFLGTIVGSEIGRSMDRPRALVYRSQGNRMVSYGVCSNITNEGARSSCKKGVADRLREDQHRMELNAYDRGYGR